MTCFLVAFLSWFGAFFRSRYELAMELLALRKQLAVLKRNNPRPKLQPWDHHLWLGLRRCWSRWASALVVVKPETAKVVGAPRVGGLHHRCQWQAACNVDSSRPLPLCLPFLLEESKAKKSRPGAMAMKSYSN